MPNWTQNELAFTGPTADLDAIQEMLKGVNGDGEEAEFSYNAIVPQTPEVLESLEANERVGDEVWYQWRIAHWGVKWDAGDADVLRNDGSLVYRFNSPWDAPGAFYEALAKKLDAMRLTVTMCCRAVHEDGGPFEVEEIYTCHIAPMGDRATA